MNTVEAAFVGISLGVLFCVVHAYFFSKYYDEGGG